MSAVFAREGKTLAGFRFEEAIRDDAAEEIALLRNRGYRIAVLSGDARERVERIAGRIGILPEDTVSEAGPDRKAEWIRSHDPERTLYVGDGANDSLAFDAAACRGTPAIGSGVLEQKCDFYFLGLGLHAIRKLIDLSDRRRCAVCLVFSVAVFYNFVAVAFALAGMMNPLVAAIIMPISSVVTLLIAAAAGREPSPERSGKARRAGLRRLMPDSRAAQNLGLDSAGASVYNAIHDSFSTLHAKTGRPGGLAAAAAMAAIGIAFFSLAEAPPARIDISSISAQMVEDVIIPIPHEIFSSLDKLGDQNWRRHLLKRDVKINANRSEPRFCSAW